MMTITVAQERFVEVAYPKALKAAHKAFRSWHERKRQDSIQESVAKLWDEWICLVNRGRNPEPLLNGLIKYAILWVKYDRRLSGRSRNIDVTDYRSGMKQQELNGKGEACPTDRSDKMNGWIDWTVKAKADDPALLASALEEVGLSLEVLKLLLFRRVWAQRGGFLLSADLGKIVVRKRTIRQPLKKEPPVLIMQDALPLFKSFLKPVSLKQRARQLVLRCVIAFLMHLGKMSASRVAGAVRTDARHRAQVSRFLGRRYWRRCDLLGQLRAQLLEMEARQGTFVFDIDQTYCSQQGKLTENTIIRGEKTKRPKKNKKKQKKYAQRSSHCFVMGLLITPSGMRLPFSVSYYTEAYCKAKKIAYRKQTELAAQLIRQLPLPPEAHVVVLGDTAFDAKAIRTACEERKFSWIVPINPERVLAGEKPRPKVSSLSEDLTADQMVCLKVHPGKGKYVDYRRISRYRIGPKFKPRTYYVHEESRDVHSVGKVRLFFSTTKAPAQGHRVEVQKTLMTNDAKLILRDVIELYQLRWQIELFFKELKSTLGLHHYRFKKFEKAETWVTLCLVTFVYLEWIRAHKLKQKALKKKEREWWQTQRTYGLALAVRQEAEQRELKLLAEKMETPTGRKVLAKQLRQSHPKEYRAAI